MIGWQRKLESLRCHPDAVRSRSPPVLVIACWCAGRTAQTIRLRSGVRGRGTPSTIVRVLMRRVVPFRRAI
jgi:hypothetical protein